MAGNVGKSPTRPRRWHSAEYRSGHVSDSQVSLMRDIPEVPEVYLNSLMDAVLPDVPTEDLNLAYRALVSEGEIEDHDNNPRWRCLPKDPGVAGKPEIKSFKFLEKVVEAADRSLLIDFNLIAKLRVTGQATPLGNRRNTSRPDGFFQLENEKPGVVDWANIIIPIEFKNVYSEQNQIDDWKCLVRIILSVLLAMDVQLGFDPTIGAVIPTDRGSEPCYDIAIQNVDERTTTVNRTVGIISDVGADSMIGRGTRIWKAQKFVGGKLVGPVYALKDVWVHEDRVPEHLIVNQIREKQPSYYQHFLTPLDYGFARLGLDDLSIFDNTHKTIRHGKDFKPTGRLIPTGATGMPASPTASNRSEKAPKPPRNSVGHYNIIPNSPQEGYQTTVCLNKHSLLHYRVVFEEIGKPVHDLRNFTAVFTAIQGGWEGLHAIHLSAHVHRDVSSGNIMLVPASKQKGTIERGVIMDLEYAKDVDDSKAPHDVKTGTVAFMATEAAITQHYRLANLRLSYLEKSPKSLEGVGPLVESITDGTPTLPLKKIPLLPLPPFRHNPLHDMESVWWLCLWVIFYLIPASIESSEEQLKNYHKIFAGWGEKQTMMSQAGTLALFAPHLLEALPFFNIMNGWRIALNEFYSIAYEWQDDLTSPLKKLRIGEDIIKTSYLQGKRLLQMLKDVSKSLPDCVTLHTRGFAN
ncbi:hypothetical protein OPQ81_008099 [Rhizoctonia solani]|nr:hypothetical protein OPQ81_008099 [Rhizoctonia solani]